MGAEIEWISFAIASASLLCTIFTLILIASMKIWNGHMFLIALMTGFQLLYDINYMLGVLPGFDACMAWHFLDILGGLGNTFTTNVISFVILYIVKKIYVFNIFDNLPAILIFVGVMPLTIAIMSLSSLEEHTDDDTYYCTYKLNTIALFVRNAYYWGRFVSIVFNFGAFIYISYRLHRIANIGSISRDSSTAAAVNRSVSSNHSVSVIIERQVLAIDNLARRMKYYPLAQAVCRSGSAWNEMNNSAYSCYASELTAHILAPLSGIFYFLIFLIMQPKARRLFCSWFVSGEETQPVDDLYAMNHIAGAVSTTRAVHRIFRVSEIDESELEGMIVEDENVGNGSNVFLSSRGMTLTSSSSKTTPSSRCDSSSVNNPLRDTNNSDDIRLSVDSDYL